jgi:hypothetical protein
MNPTTLVIIFSIASGGTFSGASSSSIVFRWFPNATSCLMTQASVEDGFRAVHGTFWTRCMDLATGKVVTSP